MERFSYGSLYHSGILGMKWGRRRYQYEDGTLTPEGRIRYGRGLRRRAARKALENNISDPVENAVDSVPSLKRSANSALLDEMTDDEIRDAASRIDMENSLLSKEVQKAKLIGEKSVTKYMATLKDVKDLTGVVSSIANDLNNMKKVADNLTGKQSNNKGGQDIDDIVQKVADRLKNNP